MATRRNARRSYSKPMLITYGSVKELTGTKSVAGSTDNMTMMTQT